MNEKLRLLEEFKEWICFVSEIREMDWQIKIAEGKWSVHDIVSHILLWDKYFFEAAINPILNNTPLTLTQIDFDQFNQDAVELGKIKTKEELIEMTIQYRNMILQSIESLKDDKLTKEYADGEFTVISYLKDFIWHDQHHIRQIDELKRRAK
ncbi:DinB family protein [Paenibacillus polymyxa]|nr:DinB family protein [Paenibacillus polymyxa]